MYIKICKCKECATTSNVLLDRVIAVLDKNELSEERFVKSLKDDYIVRVKTISYIVDAKPEVEYDIDELQKIASLMSVDKIHFIDETGTIYSGSILKYFGYSFDSGAHMAFFKQILNNYDLTLCQDVTLNTAQANEMMYAITWNESKTHRVQVGITPKRLLKELKQNQISNVVSNMPVYKGMEIYVVNSKTKIIEGATDKNKIGQKILTSNTNYQYITRKHGNYNVSVSKSESMFSQNNIVAILIVGIYLTLASCLLVLMLSRVLKEKYEKEKYMCTSNTEWAYISLDLNDLKQTNDSLGHSAGDELICAASNCMKFAFASYGKIYRIGGDEFCVLLKNRQKEMVCINKFLRLLENKREKYEFIPTVSYGSAICSGEDILTVKDRADRDMYMFKKERKERIASDKTKNYKIL